MLVPYTAYTHTWAQPVYTHSLFLTHSLTHSLTHTHTHTHTHTMAQGHILPSILSLCGKHCCQATTKAGRLCHARMKVELYLCICGFVCLHEQVYAGVLSGGCTEGETEALTPCWSETVYTIASEHLFNFHYAEWNRLFSNSIHF